MKNRNKQHSVVWIEIEITDNEKTNIENAEKFTALLHKLGIASYQRIEWNNKRWCFELYDQAGGFTELADQGHFFNLDFMIK